MWFGSQPSDVQHEVCIFFEWGGRECRDVRDVCILRYRFQLTLCVVYVWCLVELMLFFSSISEVSSTFTGYHPTKNS